MASQLYNKNRVAAHEMAILLTTYADGLSDHARQTLPAPLRSAIVTAQRYQRETHEATKAYVEDKRRARRHRRD